jgi:undecaprenyl-diphosphatase
VTAAAKAAVVTSGAFAALSVAVALNAVTSLDTRGILAARVWDYPWMLPLMRGISLLAHGYLAIPIALLVSVGLYRLGQQQDAACYAIACLSGWGANLLLKEIVRHHRPVGISPKLTDAGWYSYPSGHAMMAVLVFGLGAYFLTRRASTWARIAALAAAALLTILVAFSRVYLGAHWPSDTVGALLAGMAWASGAVAVLNRRTWRGVRVGESYPPESDGP